MHYKGKQNIDGQYNYDKFINERELKPRCKCTTAKKSISGSHFTEADRQSMFQIFWNKSWLRQLQEQGIAKVMIQRDEDARLNTTLKRRLIGFRYVNHFFYILLILGNGRYEVGKMNQSRNRMTVKEKILVLQRNLAAGEKYSKKENLVSIRFSFR